MERHAEISQNRSRVGKSQRPKELSVGQLNTGRQFVRMTWNSPRVVQLRALIAGWMKKPYAGTVVLLVGTALATLLIMAINSLAVILPNPGMIYLPLVAMLAYHWGWRYAAIAAILQLLCVYFFFIPPFNAFGPLTPQNGEQLVTLAAVTGFMLVLVQLARSRRAHAEQAAGRFAALNRVGTALAQELDEVRLLHLIAETARDLTGAEFAAFTLRPVNELGQPLVPSEGNLFYLAAVVGVSKEQEEMLRRMRLGGEGLLAPIFRYGVPVRVPDALGLVHRPEGDRKGSPLPRDGWASAARGALNESRNAARQAAFDYAHGHLPREGLRSIGIPHGHPVVRSFLGAPLLDHSGQVRGGFLLGHTEPDRFTAEDEALLVGLATQAGVALENARLYHAAQTQAQELDAIFESIDDGVTLVDDQGRILRENGTARHLRESLEELREASEDGPQQGDRKGSPLPRTDGPSGLSTLLQDASARALRGETEQVTAVTMIDAHNEPREYVVSASPLYPSVIRPSSEQEGEHAARSSEGTIPGAVVVWHDVTEARRLLRERQAHAETEARRALLQLIIDELPGSVYLVRGRDARLVLANHAAMEMWGASWSHDQPLNDFLTENGIRIFGVDGRPLAQKEFAALRVVQNGEIVHHHQEVIRHQDGTTLPVLVNAVSFDPHILSSSPLDDVGHETSAPIHPANAARSRLVLRTQAGCKEKDVEPAAIVVHQDVTPLKEAERVKDEFIGIAAHELRNPLASLKGYAQMLILQTARGRGPQLADWQTEALEAIDQATLRLVDLTEDLLDVTRLQAGRVELYLAPTNLVALTRRVVARYPVPTEYHTISVFAPPEHIITLVDPGRMEQVLNNLISNAIKYNPSGGDIEIRVHQEIETNSAMLSIHDCGIGIPAHQQARIFSRFVRADNARALGIRGTGLGLYLCREFVERQGGRIWFESVEGEGSTFFITLPLIVEAHIETDSMVEQLLD
jgi:two-component system phosphate regulon sensor histidine kinase PhoR